ncbi:hypothetical protein F2Q69_00031884 [Brassica cretica]|uniref:Glycerol-3-phosphate acyltransferase RAM2/GPAT1-8 HAD-like domain-containing protein n=1 Tax=Brassica cretica TaxID=69181 RepID=A0A8S9S024_BRACR|nr:hypothetical protein F2Q69_00031884 [Brassica cretica]
MVMETSKATSPYSVVSEFEGTLLKRDDPFSYFMLLSFDASGVIRFALLLFLWPVTALLNVFSYKNAALKLMIFVATDGLRESEIELVARMDDLSMDTWIFFQLVQEKDRGEDASTHGREKPHLGLGRQPATQCQP